MSDKRPLCKLCQERHWQNEPHVYHLRVPEMDVPGYTQDTVVTVAGSKPVGYSELLEMAPGAPSVFDAILIDRGPACSNCERLEREIAYLKAELANRNETVTHRGIVEETVTETVTTVTGGRGNKVYASPAARQKAYRERLNQGQVFRPELTHKV